MEVRFKKMYPDAILPTYSSKGDAGLDLFAYSVSLNGEYHFLEIDTGIAVEIPEGYMGLVYPRSSISKTMYLLLNSVGVIDSLYRQSIKLRFGRRMSGTDLLHENISEFEYYMPGDRVGQLVIVPYPPIQVVEARSLSHSSRGEGFGSSGR